MLPFITILIYSFLGVACLVADRSLKRFRYAWAGGLLISLVAWVLVFVSGFQISQVMIPLGWQPELVFKTSPGILLDEVSWPLAFSMTTLITGIILTSPVRMSQVNLKAWGWIFSIAAAGLISVFSLNPLSLILSWGLIDLVELGALLSWEPSGNQRNRMIGVLSFRSVGIWLFLGVLLSAYHRTGVLQFGEFTALEVFLAIFASGFRLGILPLRVPFIQETAFRRGFGTALRLVPATGSILLLARISEQQLLSEFAPVILMLTLFAGSYAASTWVFSSNELDGRVGWVSGLSALAVYASIRLQPQAVVTWGASMNFAVGLLLLSSAGGRRYFIYPAIGAIFMSVLPFSPSWPGSLIYSGEFVFSSPVFLVLQAVFLAGIFRYALRQESSLKGMEAWRVALFTVGLTLMTFSYLYLGVWYTQQNVTGILWPGLVVITLAILMSVALLRFNPEPPAVIGNYLQRFFSLEWVYAWLYRTYLQIRRFIVVISRILEGEGGILWALLLLAILLTVLSQVLA